MVRSQRAREVEFDDPGHSARSDAQCRRVAVVMHRRLYVSTAVRAFRFDLVRDRQVRLDAACIPEPTEKCSPQLG